MPKANPIVASAELRRRLLERITPSDGCWEWQGARHPEGYGRITVSGRLMLAHRAAYVVFAGPLPEHLVIDHLCRNRLCVNPAHLEPVTDGENTRRGDAPPAIVAREGVCQRDHAREPGNVASNGHCKKCAAHCKREWRAAREAADPRLRESRLAELRRYRLKRGTKEAPPDATT